MLDRPHHDGAAALENQPQGVWGRLLPNGCVRGMWKPPGGISGGEGAPVNELQSHSATIRSPFGSSPLRGLLLSIHVAVAVAAIGAGQPCTCTAPAGVRPGPGRGPGVDFYVTPGSFKRIPGSS